MKQWGVHLNNRCILDSNGVLGAYPIGTIYMNVNETSPAELFGGVWEQLTADAYFKIVASNGGNFGGTSSEHKIPIESMPNHNHTQHAEGSNYSEPEVFRGYGDSETGSFCGNSHRANNTEAIYIQNGSRYITTMKTGGGQPYYPYYYGIYAWIRID